MSVEIKFEHHYQEKYLEAEFPAGLLIQSTDEVMAWRQTWLGSLSSWHSPYKALINGEGIKLGAEADHKELKAAFERMAKLLSGFFLKRAVIYGIDEDLAEILPFEVASNRQKAMDLLKIRVRKDTVPADFRSAISLENHFQQHVMELSFEAPVTLDDKEKISTLKSKITNNLMQWHSSWNLLIDCTNLECKQELETEFESMLKFFKGFFLKEVLGYNPKEKGLHYPFKVYRSRHAAAGRLESEGSFSGSDANCQSRK